MTGKRPDNRATGPDHGGFLRRWHRRKAQNGNQWNGAPQTDGLEAGPETTPATDQPTTVNGSDLATDKPGEWPVDLLRELFRQREFAALDGLNEYDEDYTAYLPRGNFVGREMKRSADRHLNSLQSPAGPDTPSENGAAHRLAELESAASGRISGREGSRETKPGGHSD